MSDVDQQINTGQRRAPVAMRQLVLSRHAHPSARAASGDVRGLRLLPRRRRYRRRRRPRPRALPCSIAGARISRASTPDAARPALPSRWQGRSWPSLCGKRISSLSSTAWKWMCARDIRAPDWRRSTSIAIGSLRAVGRLSVKIFGIEGEETGNALSHHLGRALQMTNILRDLDEDAGHRPALSSRGGAARAGYRQRRYRQGVCRIHDLGEACVRRRRRARDQHFAEASAVMASLPQAERAVAAHHGGGLSALLEASSSSAAGPRRGRRFAPPSFSSSGCPALRRHLMAGGTVHIVGAGLAGLAAAVGLPVPASRWSCYELRPSRRRPLPLLFRARAWLSRSTTATTCCCPANHAALAFLRNHRQLRTSWSGRARPNSPSPISPRVERWMLRSQQRPSAVVGFC